MMSFRHSHREAFYFHNNLTGLAKAIENKYTTIDLRDEATVTGKVVLVDGFMNIDLEDAVFYDARGNELPFEAFFVRGRNVRYIHIPLDINIADTIKDLGKQERKLEPFKKKRTFKVKRAIQRQQELLAELTAKQKEKD